MFFRTNVKTISGMVAMLGASLFFLYPGNNFFNNLDNAFDNSPFLRPQDLHDSLQQLSDRYSRKTLELKVDQGQGDLLFSLNALTVSLENKVKNTEEYELFEIPNKEENGKSYMIKAYESSESSGKKCYFTFEEKGDNSEAESDKLSAMYLEAVRKLQQHHSSDCSNNAVGLTVLNKN